MISGNVPNHMVATARTGFLRAYRDTPAQWRMIATQYDLAGSYDDLVDLGDAPMPTESKTGLTAQDFIERTLRVEPKSWDITVHLSYNSVKDDRTGTLEGKVKGAGVNFNKHFDKLVFQALNGGDGSTYGLCYDGKNFFANDHADSGAKYTTAQDNMLDLTLTLDNFETAWVAGSTYLSDQGEQTGFIPNLLVVPPAGVREAANIANNTWNSANANNEINPWSGQVDYITSPYLDSSAWTLLSTNENIKPVMLVMREEPSLQEAWFDPEAPEGGHYYFKYYARYWVSYTDWRLATMGDS